MLQLPGHHPALDAFIRNGQADGYEVERILREIGSVSSLDHVTRMLQRAQPPVTISDGVESE
jgi:hypothetical protein